MNPDPVAVEWFRPDPRRRLYRAWAIGSALVVAGAVLGMLVVRISDWPAGVRAILTLLALVVTGLGPVMVLRAAFAVLSDDVCLVLRSDGVLYQAPGEQRFVAWNDLVATAYDAARDAIVLELEADEVRLPGVGALDADPGRIVERITAVRRRALLGLLPSG